MSCFSIFNSIGKDRKGNPSLPFKTEGKQVTEMPDLKGITKENIHAGYAAQKLWDWIWD